MSFATENGAVSVAVLIRSATSADAGGRLVAVIGAKIYAVRCAIVVGICILHAETTNAGFRFEAVASVVFVVAAVKDAIMVIVVIIERFRMRPFAAAFSRV